jgi:hypothetical protein
MHQHINQRGFTHIGTANKGKFGQVSLGAVLYTGVADDKTRTANFHEACI